MIVSWMETALVRGEAEPLFPCLRGRGRFGEILKTTEIFN